MPEFAIKDLLTRLGVDYMYQIKVLGYKVDFFLPSENLIIEYRSCFWHPHECSRSRIPKSHKEYWEPKLRRNSERDLKKDSELESAGYRVFIVRDCNKARRLSELEILLKGGAGA
jgi:DNA mismatch endonuclease (patch repair protein)